MSEILARSLMGSSAVRYFFEVAKAGSFRKASERLGIAASAIHRQVGLLEKQMDTPLLQRGRGRDGVRLTAAGEMMVHRIGRAMVEISTAVGEIQDLRKAKRGKVRIGTTDALAIDIIAPFLAEFSSLNPRIDIEVWVTEKEYLFADYERKQSDVLLAFNAPIQIGLKTICEFLPSSCVVVHRDHPMASRSSVSLAECAQYPLALNVDAVVLEGIVSRITAAAGIKPRIALASNSYTFMREVVARGNAISIAGAFSGRFRPHHDSLAYVPLRENLGRFSTLGIYVPMARRHSAASEMLVANLVEAMRREAPQKSPVAEGASAQA